MKYIVHEYSLPFKEKLRLLYHFIRSKFYPPGRKSVAFLQGSIWFSYYLFVPQPPPPKSTSFIRGGGERGGWGWGWGWRGGDKKFFKSLHNNIVYTLYIYIYICICIHIYFCASQLFKRFNIFEELETLPHENQNPHM